MGKHSVAKLKDLAIKTRRPGFYSDGNCLYLRVGDSDSGRWRFRYTIAGKTRDIGLGPIGKLLPFDRQSPGGKWPSNAR